jgi:ribosome-associated protein
MIEITSEITIHESELTFDFVRSTGPGGQNVNKVSTAVQMRFDVEGSPSLPEDVKERLVKLAGNRITKDGMLMIEAKRHRTQEANRQDAVNRLVSLIQQAAHEPKTRKKTRPTKTAKAARLADKKRHSQKKRWRNYNPDDWE